MPHDIDHNTAAQRRTSKLLAAMAIFICLGIVAYIILTLLVNRQTPANPDTHYTGTNGVSVYYDGSIWKVCQMTEDATLGTVLELATADSADGAEDYQAVLLQRGTADTYPDFIDDSEKDLKQAYGIIKPRPERSTGHAGGGPAAAGPGARPAGRAGAADVRQGRCHELKSQNGEPKLSVLLFFAQPLCVPVPHGDHVAEHAAALGGQLHIPVITAEEPFFIGQLQQNFV